MTISTASATSQSEKEIFFLKYAKHSAKALYSKNEMVLLKGSEIRKTTVKSAEPLKRENRLKKIATLCKDDGEKLILQQDLPTTSPSDAAWIIAGAGLNGWVTWKTANGKTLDDVYRKISL